ncbi:MAG: hypothetical protein ACI8TQ_003644 [Planctomycetota bacterium]
MTEDQSASPEDVKSTEAVPEVTAELAAEEAGEGADVSSSPYRNLFVPLVIVPAMIVIVLVLVFVLFGQIAGDEKSMAENLERVQTAGANERDQALFLLVRQIDENWADLQAGKELRWTMEGDITTELTRVFNQTPPEDIHFRYVLAATLAQMDEVDGIGKLLSCLEINPAYDGEGTVRFNVIVGLGVAATSMTDDERARTVKAIVPFLEGDDLGLQLATAGALQGFPGAESVAALRGVLGAGELELRGQAAVSLSHLGEEDGAEVLWELVDRASYERAREGHPEKFRRESQIVAVRERAVSALCRLGRAQDLERLKEIAAGDPDLDVREEAMRGLAALENGEVSE